ncbi:pyrroline-5-carboxylate reductase dimerization domain-containing protein [Candidatus Haliotispira prima]|uniref:Pyrroline-5-carboxylate reductase n=1 Tax=Candidatus Haliotispira prima TaxID=3034016 RepID=A0ABY8MET8_9SPIO|nr:pyrroline-5-carboxylate reductase dimerization domain-containing protein [Candidatus Haliotispira prima]
MNILLLGCGNMGGAMLRTWLPLVAENWREVWILRISEQSRAKLEATEEYASVAERFHFVSSFAELRLWAEQRQLHFSLIVLGMKPQVIQEEMHNCLAFDRNSLWLTMAAGLPLSWYRERKADLRIVRIMPNLGAQVGGSASLLYLEPDLELSQGEEELVVQLAHSIGPFVRCDSEARLDNATPVTGSGPAYFYLLTELLQLELEKQGFDAEAACRLAEATFLGAATCLADARRQARENRSAIAPGAGTDSVGGPCDLAAQMRRAVTSKAGVTEAALSVLTPKLQSSFALAVKRGIERNRELQNLQNN